MSAPQATWDDVIIGAGSAGAVLAARLSADPRRRVLLLEAGPEQASSSTPSGIAGTDMWAALGEAGRIWPALEARYGSGPSAAYLRGRGVGGSSAVNALIGLRGLPADYDRWEEELGCTGWNGATMTEMFCAVEDDSDLGGDGAHGRGGPIPLTRRPRSQWTPFERALGEAASALGYPMCPDANRVDAFGFGPLPLTARDLCRVSTNDAYLEPARGRSGLEIRGDTLVDAVLLDGPTAVGVRTADGTEISARRVIVAAGAIHSPAVLLRSGIGGTDGVPVGRNLMDHPAATVVVLLADGARAAPDQPVISSALRYTSGYAGSGVGDMQVVPLGYGPGPDGDAAALLSVSAMQVFSRGSVTLRGADPQADPLVEFGMLSDERDLARMLEGLHLLAELVRQPAIAEISLDVRAGAHRLADLDEAGLRDWLHESVSGYAHAVGTCRMGTAGDPAAVVDPHCAVVGYQGLYVVDASVIPDIPRANTHLTTVAIAERIARELTNAHDHDATHDYDAGQS